MDLLVTGLLFLGLGALTFHPAFRLFQARNPPFSAMVLTLAAAFLGVYAALELSRSGERRVRRDRAAMFLERAGENLAVSRGEARKLLGYQTAVGTPMEGAPSAGSAGPAGLGGPPENPYWARGLTEVLATPAVLEQISPEGLKALLDSRAELEGDLRDLAAAISGAADVGGRRPRRRALEDYLRELAYAQGILVVEAEYQRGHIDRKDAAALLRRWSEMKTKTARPM